MSAGTLTGIGVGPGDPELLTLKAVQIIGASPVIAYIAANDGESLARRIAAPHVPAGRIEQSFPMPMGFGAAEAGALYDRIAVELGRKLDDGLDVAFLCEGDALLYGSFMYVLQRMAGRYRCAVIPGITSMTAAASRSLWPIASRNQSLAILPATASDERLEAVLAATDAVVLLKVGRHLNRVRDALARHAMLGDARLIEHATTPEERIRPLADVIDNTAPYFSLVLARR